MTNPIDEATFAALVEMTGGELDFVDDLVDTYLDDGRTQLETMRVALRADDIPTLGRAAHSMKSGSLNVGALELGARCRTLEEQARGGSVDDGAGQVAASEAAIGEVRDALLRRRSERAT
jgi:HPt (histidine-containing phosphotransfer) domain-containing protein